MRLEDLLLSLFELPNLGDPREFIRKMPDAPDTTRVNQAITRLLELNALAKQKGQSQPKPTFFGRFLQKMPLDPDVGFLVMSGVRLQLVQDSPRSIYVLWCLWIPGVFTGHYMTDRNLKSKNLTESQSCSIQF